MDHDEFRKPVHLPIAGMISFKTYYHAYGVAGTLW